MIWSSIENYAYMREAAEKIISCVEEMCRVTLRPSVCKRSAYRTSKSGLMPSIFVTMLFCYQGRTNLSHRRAVCDSIQN